MYSALALSARIFTRESKEWHCTIRGPAGTEFEGGLYHFRILLPSEYPFRPPSILMLTPNGRFELNTKVRLLISPIAATHSLVLDSRSASVSPTVRSVPDPKIPSRSTFNTYFPTDHEESWQPAWGVRTGMLPSSIVLHPTLNCYPCHSNSRFTGFLPTSWQGCARSRRNGFPRI